MPHKNVFDKDQGGKRAKKLFDEAIWRMAQEGHWKGSAQDTPKAESNKPRMTAERSSVALKAKRSTGVRQPSMYKVILYNDNQTPMAFVVGLLQQLFHMTLPDATSLMMNVHRTGSGVCGVFTYEVAETKRMLVLRNAQHEQYPLKCCIERA